MGTEVIIVGVGAEQGLGAAVARRFAREGHHVLLAGRTAEKLDRVAAAIQAAGGSAEAVVADATDEAAIGTLFARAHQPEIVVFNAGSNLRRPFRELTVVEVENTWRTNTLGGFIVAREAARHLVPQGRGTLILTGATASLRGASGFAAFAAAKAGLRALAQSAARELGPLGLHVAHAVIDGGIDGERLRSRSPERAEAAGPDGLLSIDAIAEAYWQLHRQHRSAWTLELDLRPYGEKF
ncbi:SDR family NAD(P)-dependent oxidoreductase [Rhodovarius crocodyli]|uniref:SDR family NAD(P)-dependent oxidoreductase n=1 Tax=Rhodovarius crocodyli TaxID=1979269 RepID=A0A437M1R4_9PROT|nr:SDR family NAD(P)-dependent oxidoreductase [Rhodovarius crocodyli]RVT91650.1 SDR family NAD(P)-dependent oxidoreductase [Rhodovarius crocodyli]